MLQLQLQEDADGAGYQAAAQALWSFMWRDCCLEYYV